MATQQHGDGGSDDEALGLWWSRKTRVASLYLHGHLVQDGSDNPRRCSIATVEYHEFHTADITAYFAAFEEMIRVLEELGQQCVLLMRFDTVPASGGRKSLAALKLMRRQVKWNKAMADRLTAAVRATALVFSSKFIRGLVNLVLKLVPPRNPLHVAKSGEDGAAWLLPFLQAPSARP